MDINTCLETTLPYHTIAYYSHLIPVFITVILSVFALVKSRYSLLSKIFSLFTFGFCLWLIGDVVLWTQNDYNLINFLWAPLDYINILFYILGTYFFMVVVNERDISVWQKIGFISLTLPAWWITITNQSITAFNQPVCEAFNNEFLTQYKLGVEIFVVVFIIVFAIMRWRQSLRDKRKQIIIVSTALILFFGVFSVTEYISSQTGVYEINLYSLFVLPVFLFMMIYSIANLKVFNLRLIGTQLIVYVMIIMVGSQFFFLENTTNQILTILTFVLSLSFGVLLIRDGKKEIEQRERIEKLAVSLDQTNVKLKEANLGQANLMHFMNHQVKGRLGIAKNIFAELLTTDYGIIPAEAKPLVEKGLEEVNLGVNYVQSILRGASAESGVLPYDMRPMDFKTDVEGVVESQKLRAENKGLKFMFTVDSGDYKMKGDAMLLGEAVKNLIDNSINYTPYGGIDVSLKNTGKFMQLIVKDTGIGITNEDKPKLFKSGGRGTDSIKTNVDSTGYGLVFVKKVIEAHKGTVSVDSEGKGKGSTFTIDLPKN
ncbi:MAG: HAMP domain-containing sensor histidine kinase [Minisyncoccia bacterium]